MRFIYDRYKGEKTIYYGENYMSCDTETSWNHDENNPICWISSIQVYFCDEYYLFRKPSEFIEFLSNIINKYQLNFNKRIKILFHNSSYDLSYLIGFFQLYLPEKDDISILNDGHKIINYRQGGIEIMDTYGLTNLSLENWGKNLNIEHKKKVGLYDYSKIIYQDDELNEDEKLYDKFDVLALHECFDKQLKNYDDTVATVPYTATGYIRRVFRRKAQNNKPYMQMFKDNRLDEFSYTMSVKAFGGGFTHGNRFQQNLLKANIGHRDFRSHYPSQMRCYPLPFGKPNTIYDISDIHDKSKKFTVKDVLDLYPKYSSLVKIIITKAELKDKNITMPFMQFSKLYNMTKNSKYKMDNGRILKFDGFCELVVDNLTLKILSEQYNIIGRIMTVVVFENCYMPPNLASVIDAYFQGKSDNKIKLKEFEETLGKFAEETIEQADVLRRDKNGLNGCYGMFAQNPLHEVYDINYEYLKEDSKYDIFSPVLNTKSTDELLDIFYNNRNSFLPYQISWAITSLARYELYEYMKIIGYENVLYCDTDSIFYIKNSEIEEKIEKLNKIKYDNAIKLGAYITNKNGKIINYDNFSDENENIIAFKQLHAKCYGYVYLDKNNIPQLKVTIAGVPERTIIAMNGDEPIYLRREEELGGITKEMKLKGQDKFDPFDALDKLTDNFAFNTNTGSTSKYLVELPHIVIIDGHEIETCGGCIISTPTEKKISDISVEDFEIEIIKGDI